MQIKHLRPGDVLLSRGHDWLSDLIQFLDGGKYSHAGFFDGDRVVEAGTPGILYNAVEQDLKVQVFIDAYRFRNDAGLVLADPGLPAAPVVECAREYRDKGAKFAYNQLFLMAFLATSRRVPLPLFWKHLLRTAMDHAFEVIDSVFVAGKEPVTCSELVYRCFDEAKPVGEYGLSIEGVLDLNKAASLAASNSLLTESDVASDDPDVLAFDQKAQEFMKTYFAARSKTKTVSDDMIAAATKPLTVADTVTPKDLETSTNLQFMGRLTL